MLIVIDAQDCFVSRRHPEYSKTIDKIIQQIVIAKVMYDDILIVEYDDNAQETYGTKPSSSPTIKEIVNLVKDYDKCTYVFKRGTDGGNEVFKTLQQKNIAHQKIHICGFYANFCVKETVITLADKIKDSKIKVLKNAICCYDGDDFGFDASISQMSEVKNVRIAA